MTERVTLEEIPEGADQPATRRDLTALRKEVLSVMAEMKEDILHHFDAAVENIEDSLRGANADELALLKDKLQVHDERIAAAEARTGLR